MTTPLPFALFAADWIDVIVPVVVFVVWIINQIAGAKKVAGGPARKPPPPANVPGQPAAPQAGGQRSLMDEVEQFLREARKTMEQGGAQRPKQAPQQQRPPKPAAAAKQKPQRQKKSPSPMSKPIGKLSPADQPRLPSRLSERPVDEVRLGGSVAQHVQEHLDTSRFDERAGKLSHLKQTVEHDIGSHVENVFDHHIGSLVPQSASGTSSEVANPALQIAAMLRDPASMRNAIILQEILSPPTHRW